MREILAVPGDRTGKARRISAAIRESGEFPWVGLYDRLGIVAWSGSSSQGSIVALPIRNATGEVVGRLDVEGDPADWLEECARVLTDLLG